MFIVTFPDHYSEIMRVRVIVLLLLIEGLGYSICFGCIVLRDKYLSEDRKRKKSKDEDAVSKNGKGNINEK